jgi:hypothetical protein
MNDNYSKLSRLEIDTSDSSYKEELLSSLERIKMAGYKNMIVEIYGDSRRSAGEEKLDLELFDKIRLVQSLPADVVFDLMKVKGKLINSGIAGRILLR